MIVVTIAMEVIRRFVLSYSSIWGEEIARYAFIYLAWIGAAAAVKDRAHIRIDVLMHYLSNRSRTVLYLLGDLLTMVLALVALLVHASHFHLPGIWIGHPRFTHFSSLVHFGRSFRIPAGGFPAYPIHQT